MVAEMKKGDGLREIQTIELSEKIANVGGRLQYIVSSSSTCIEIKSIFMSENRIIEWFRHGECERDIVLMKWMSAVSIRSKRFGRRR